MEHVSPAALPKVGHLKPDTVWVLEGRIVVGIILRVVARFGRLDDARKALAPYAGPEGVVTNGTAWLVTACR
ncbi:MAG: hypothetical protein ACFB50_15000 [Rubrobacteraceae bacterium]